jgi:ABC-2 type transport system permease protein
MSSILLLTGLQLRETLGGIRAVVEKRTGANGAIAGTILIGLMVFAGIAWLGYAAYGAVCAFGLSKTVYDILFLICGALTFTFSLPSILGSFFGSSDIDDLLPLPVSPFAVVLSKALSALTTAYVWTALLIAGPLAGWGMAAGEGVHFWVTYVLSVAFAPLMPVAYAGTLSMVIAALFRRVRRKDAITTLATVLSLLVSLGIFFLSNSLRSSDGFAQALGGMSDAMGGVVMAFPAYGFAVYALSHPDPLGTCMFVLLSLASFAVFVLVARLVYMRIVTTLSSGGAHADAYDGTASHAQTPVLKALLRTEVRKVVRNSSVLLNYVGYPLVISPALYVFMFSTGSMASLGESLGHVENATANVAGFALALIMALTALNGSSNKIASTGISREGSNWTYLKYVPVPIETSLRAKVLVGYAVSALVDVLFLGGGGFLLVTRAGVDPLVVAGGLVLMLGASWLMTCVGAWNESRAPKVDWGNDGEVNVKAIKSSGGGLRLVLVGTLYSALPLLVSPLVGLEPRVFMPVLAVAGVVVAVVVGRVLLAAAVRNIERFE